MIITFDNKILLFKDETKEILFEQIIEAIKIYPPESKGVFDIKDKKAKVKFLVEFEKIDQEDEFFLHLNKMNVHK